MTKFEDLGLASPILKALQGEGYTTPTPIQGQSIPIMREGRDLLGIAQTGTGKTAAFALPILDRFERAPLRPAPKSCRALVLAPTRELANQIRTNFQTYGRFQKLRIATVYGGVPIVKQIRQLSGGIDILIATPGRLLDLMSSNSVRVDMAEVLVLDEADQMLDMGFIQPIRKIVEQTNPRRQTVLFSATMPKSIADLAANMLKDPARVEVTPVATTAEKVEQRIVHTERSAKRSVLIRIINDHKISKALVFTRTKHGADRLADQLVQAGISADAIHGDRSQGQRERTLGAFRKGNVGILVATDIAARGIDVDGVTHVLNYDLPNIPESYVHRIGRTARAGADGMAISLCSADENAYLRDIERLIRQKIDLLDGYGNPEPIRSSDNFRKGGKPGGQRRGNGGGESRGQGRGHSRGQGWAQSRGNGKGPGRGQDDASRPFDSARPERGEGVASDENRRNKPFKGKQERRIYGKPAEHRDSREEGSSFKDRGDGARRGNKNFRNGEGKRAEGGHDRNRSGGERRQHHGFDTAATGAGGDRPAMRKKQRKAS